MKTPLYNNIIQYIIGIKHQGGSRANESPQTLNDSVISTGEVNVNI